VQIIMPENYQADPETTNQKLVIDTLGGGEEMLITVTGNILSVETLKKEQSEYSDNRIKSQRDSIQLRVYANRFMEVVLAAERNKKTRSSMIL